MDFSPRVENESPPLRSTILGSFLRGRPRGTSQSHITVPDIQTESTSPRALSPGSLGHRRGLPAGGVQTTVSHNPHTNSPGLGLSHMLRRRRSAGTIATSPATSTAPIPIPAPAPTPPLGQVQGPTHRIRMVPHIDSRKALRFDPITRDLREGDAPLRIGRFTDRSGLGLSAINAVGSNKLAFKSKVVSRAHAEVWADVGGKFFIKDTKSSSGTFLNHVRLSAAGDESRPFQIKDGDIVQLGVDYQGGAEDAYKSVKMRIELGREWQAAANAFNTNAMQNLKTLALVVTPSKSTGSGTAKSAPKGAIPDCCICLFSVTIRQALFVAPCSHAFHYKCIRPLLDAHHPAFTCPLCRTFADLEEDVEIEAELESVASEEVEAEVDEMEGVEGMEGVVGVCADKPLPPVDRDRGAETDVEDAGAGASGSRSAALVGRNHRTRESLNLGPLIDLREPDTDGEEGSGDGDVDGDEDLMFVDAALGHVPAPTPPPAHDDRSVSGSRSATGSPEELVPVATDMLIDTAVGTASGVGAGAVGEKRKRAVEMQS